MNHNKMKKKILITGITGMVGSHMLDLLIKKTNWEIFGMCRWRSPLDNVQHIISNKKERIKFLYGDLNDSISLDSVIKESKPDYVLHFAAQSFPKTSFEEPIITLDTNILGTYRLLNSIKSNNINPIILICSSSEVFGRVSRYELPINEECKYHPASPYAISKVGTDLIGRFFYEAYNLKTITTRMFTHTGPRRGDVFAESSFAKQIALIEVNKANPTIFVGNLKSLRTYSDVRDAVNAYFLLITKNPRPGEYYNIGGNYTCTVGNMLKFLLSITNFKKKIKIQIDKNRIREIDADLQVPNVSKFKKHTGWEPKIKFEKTMTDLLNHWRSKVINGNFLIR
jgi:GDP-mannose 4,6-dehydratase